jgi:serine/threonine protein kinase
VAIKVVDRSRNDTRSTRLLLREARIVAALTHPAICGVHEVGRVGGEPFIVMEFVEGAKLSTMIRQECLLLERALHYGIQVVDAVAHAYDHNVVHGDLKSSSIMVAPDGRVQILDFGLVRCRPLAARGASSEAHTTSPSEFLSGAGTVPYMVPELLRCGCADARSDIWALGVVFFEMLAAAGPFRAQRPTRWRRLSPTSLVPLPRRLPAALRQLVSRCLMKHPHDRYRSISQLAAALDDLD